MESRAAVAASARHRGQTLQPLGSESPDQIDLIVKQTAQNPQQVANRTRPLRAEVQQIDGRLEKLGAEKAALESQLAGGTLAGAEIAEAGRRLNHIAAEVAMLEERWLALQAEIEQIGAAG